MGALHCRGAFRQHPIAGLVAQVISDVCETKLNAKSEAVKNGNVAKITIVANERVGNGVQQAVS